MYEYLHRKLLIMIASMLHKISKPFETRLTLSSIAKSVNFHFQGKVLVKSQLKTASSQVVDLEKRSKDDLNPLDNETRLINCHRQI